MPTMFTDANELVIVGENPYMMIHQDPGDAFTTHVSFWRARFSPQGPGHVAFWFSELTGGEPRIYADNIALARWLQEEILPDRLPYKDLDLPVADARFERAGEVPWYVTETVRTGTDTVQFTWYGFLDAFNGRTDPEPGERYGHTASYVPATRARVSLNGKEAAGGPIPRERGGYQNSSCFLALAESWVRVRD